MRKIAEDDKTWEYPGKGPDGKDKKISAAGRIVDPEPLARDYYLPNTDMRDNFKDYRRLSRPELWQGSQRGLLRRNPRQISSQAPGTVPGNVPAPAPGSNPAAASNGIMGPAPGSPITVPDGIYGPAPGSPIIAPTGIPA